MRKIVFTIVSLFFVASIYSQKLEVPEKVENAFKEKFENSPAENAEWSSNDKGWYVVHFTQNERSSYIQYHPEGYLLEHGAEIQFKELIKEVSDAFTEKYNKKDVVIIYRINSAAAPERNVIVINENAKKTNLYYAHDGSLYDVKLEE